MPEVSWTELSAQNFKRHEGVVANRLMDRLKESPVDLRSPLAELPGLVQRCAKSGICSGPKPMRDLSSADIYRLRHRVDRVERVSNAKPAPTLKELCALQVKRFNLHRKKLLPKSKVVRMVLMRVSIAKEIPVQLICSRSRIDPVAKARQVCMALLYAKAGLNYPQIGRIFKRHHAAVINAVRVVNDFCEIESVFKQEFEALEQQIELNLGDVK